MSNLNSPKVFCVGFHKTGTTSLNYCLKRLGYNLTGPNGVNDPDISKNVYSMCYSLAEQYDAFVDNPWPIVFKEMDIKYPNSKFILTVRPVNEWYESISQHFKDTTTPMREWIYGKGSPIGNKKIYIDRYVRHYEEVYEYFKNRNDAFMEFNLVGGDGWAELCAFLSKEPISGEVPHLNKGLYKV